MSNPNQAHQRKRVSDGQRLVEHGALDQPLGFKMTQLTGENLTSG